MTSCKKRGVSFIIMHACSVTQSCSTLCDPMDCSLPDSSIHWIFQARILEWAAISFSREMINQLWTFPVLWLPRWLRCKEFPCQCREHRFDPWCRKIPHAMEQLSPCTITTEICMPIACVPQQEKLLQWEAHTPQAEKARAATKTQQSWNTR